MRPIALVLFSANQSALSGPTMMPSGPLPKLIGNSATTDGFVSVSVASPCATPLLGVAQRTSLIPFCTCDDVTVDEVYVMLEVGDAKLTVAGTKLNEPASVAASAMVTAFPSASYQPSLMMTFPSASSAPMVTACVLLSMTGALVVVSAIVPWATTPPTVTLNELFAPLTISLVIFPTASCLAVLKLPPDGCAS